jgi:hypothetical protein
MLCFGFALGAVMFVSAQSATAPKANYFADSVTRNGDSLQMRGHVRIAACGIVTADEADGNASDITLSGDVRFKLTNGIDPLR